MLDSIIVWLQQWVPLFDYLAPLLKLFELVFMVIVTGASSYAAITIHTLRREVTELSEELHNAYLVSAVHQINDRIRSILQNVEHDRLHKDPQIPGALVALARKVPSMSNDLKILALIDNRHWHLKWPDRKSVTVFTDQGIHLPDQTEATTWDEFIEGDLDVERSGTLSTGKGKLSLMSSDKRLCAIYTKLQRELRAETYFEERPRAEMNTARELAV